MASNNTLWGLDPQYSSFRKLLAYSVKNSIVNESNGNFFQFLFHNRPISKVEIAGIVVNIVIQSRRISIYVDDGTGVVKCMKILNDGESYPISGKIVIGSLVSVKGIIAMSESNEDEYGYLILIKQLEFLLDSNSEIMHWTSSIILHETEYKRKLDLLIVPPKL